jgi:peptidoglycan hydrolase CwlO-like protein
MNRDPLINITSAIYDLIKNGQQNNPTYITELNNNLVTMIHQLESMNSLMNMIQKNTSMINYKLDESNAKADQLNSKIDKLRSDVDKIVGSTASSSNSLNTLVTLETVNK